MYKRVLLKLSGEALAEKAGSNIIDVEKLNEVVANIIELHKNGVQVAVVIGAGNIWRGKVAEKIGIERIPADFMGMMGTVINAVAIAGNLKKKGISATVFSAIPAINDVTLPYDAEEVKKHLDAGEVCFLAGGTGKPFFTTDTAAVLRALETKCDAILMGKNGVKGVYDKDPKVYNDAKFFETITYQQMIDLGLQIMDQSAVDMIKDTDLEILVFSMAEPENFIKAAQGINVGTICRRK